MTRTVKLTLTALLSAASLAALVAGSGCGRTAEASSTGVKASPVADGADKPVAKGYTFETKPIGTYKVGEKGAIELIVTADEKTDWHVNLEYPTRFKAPDAKGDVDFAQPALSLAKDAASFKLEACKKGDVKCVMHVTVPVTPSKKGKVRVGGTLYFGVCDPKVCLNPKEEVALDIDVK